MIYRREKCNLFILNVFLERIYMHSLGVQIVFFRCCEELQWFASCKEIWRAGTLTAMLQTEVNKSRSSSRYDNIQHR